MPAGRIDSPGPTWRVGGCLMDRSVPTEGTACRFPGPLLVQAVGWQVLEGGESLQLFLPSWEPWGDSTHFFYGSPSCQAVVKNRRIITQFPD